MKKHVIKIILYLIFVLLLQTSFSFAQNWKDQWKQNTSSTSRTFFESLADAEQYFIENPTYVDTPQSGYKDYMRFLNFWKNKINYDGTYTDYTEALLDYISSTNASSHASSNWTILGPTSRPPQRGTDANHGMGWVNTMDVFPSQKNLLYAGSNSGGLFKTSNGGNSWTFIPFTDISIGIQSIAIDPNDSNTVFIATGTTIYEKNYGLGVFKTINGGSSWTKVYFDSVNPTEVIQKVIVDPSNSSNIYIAYKGKIFKSTNGGSSFTQKLNVTYNSNDRNVKFSNIVFKPNDTDVIYASGKTLYRSVDGGDNWEDITLNTSIEEGYFSKVRNNEFKTFLGSPSFEFWVTKGAWYSTTSDGKTVAKIKPILNQVDYLKDTNYKAGAPKYPITYYFPEHIYNFKLAVKLPANTSIKLRLVNESRNELIFESGFQSSNRNFVEDLNYYIEQNISWLKSIQIEVTANSSYTNVDWLEIDYIKVISYTADKISVATTLQFPDKLFIAISSFMSTGYRGISVNKSNNIGTNFTSLKNMSAGGFNKSHVDTKFNLAVSPTDTNTQYLGLIEIYKTTNQWDSDTMLTSSEVHADIRQMKIFNNSGSDNIYLANDGGVSVSTNSASTWADKSNGLTVTQYFGIAGVENNPDLLIGGCQDLSTNLYIDKVWENTGGGDGYGDPFIDPFNNDIMFSRCNEELQRSTDKFLSYDLISDAKRATDFTAIITNYESQSYTIYAYADSVIKSTAKGAEGSWTSVSSNAVIGNKGISSIAICESNPNYIYFSEQFPGSGAKIWRSTIGGGLSSGNWTNITGTLPTLYAGITDIAVDPSNPNRVWVTLGNMSEGNKVYFRDFSQTGTNWVNFSDGIDDSKYNLPVNCIKYWNGSNDGLFIGTDVGVFYRDNSMSEWVEYNNGFHPTIIQDLEINNLDHKIRAATFSRGLWESPLPQCTYNSIDYLVEGPDTISTYTKMNRNIVVKNNGIFVVKSRLIMSNDTKITVNKGGKIIIDGGHITNTCGGMWEGIIVEGSKIDAQSAYTHGWCEVKNSGTIENARVAIRSLSGGVVKVNNGNFYNNRFGIAFNLYNLNNNSQHRNLSYVANSDFLCTTPMVDSITYTDNGVREGSKSFISIAQQDGVRIISNNFISTYRPRADLKGTGIVTWVSRAEISNNDFTGLTYGIESGGYQNLLQYNRVVGNNFNDVSLAITETAMAGSQLRENTIALPAYESNAWLMENYGIKQDASRSFNISNNSIRVPSSINNANTYGVLVRNSDTILCTIEHNFFRKLEFANQLERKNRKVKIQCNQYNQSIQDWSINPLVADTMPDMGFGVSGQVQRANYFPDNEGGTGIQNIRLNDNMSFQYFSVAAPDSALPFASTSNVELISVDGTNYEEECLEPFDPCGGNPVPCVAYAQGLVSNNSEASADLVFKYKLNLAQQLRDSGMMEELRTMIEAETSSEWEEIKLPIYIGYGENMGINAQDYIDRLATSDYKYFMQFIFDFKNLDIPIDSIGDSELKESIEEIAGRGSSISPAAKKILELFYGYQYVREAERWEESSMVRHNSGTTKTFVKNGASEENKSKEVQDEFKEYNNPDFLLIPNPSNGDFIVKLISSASGFVYIIDMHGKVISEVELAKNGDLRIGKGTISPGVYTIRLVNGVDSYQLNKRLIILE